MQTDTGSFRDDGQLIRDALSNGSDRAFEQLMARHRDFVYGVCRRITCGGAEADDAVQQVFLTLSQKLPELAARASIAGWLYHTAWQVSARTRRAAVTRRTHEQLAAKKEAVTRSARALEPDTAEQLLGVVNQLPDEYQEAIVLHYFNGYTVAETASRMRCPTGTVASRISRGLKLIRERMTDRGLVLTAVGIKLALLAERNLAKAAGPGGAPPATPVRPGLRPRWFGRPRGFITPSTASSVSAAILFGATAVWAKTFRKLPTALHGPFAAGLIFLFATTGFSAVCFGPELVGAVAERVTNSAIYLAIESLLDFAGIAGPQAPRAGQPLPAATADQVSYTYQAPDAASVKARSDAYNNTYRGGAVAVPEPGCLAVVCLAGIGLVRRGRKQTGSGIRSAPHTPITCIATTDAADRDSTCSRA
jgi:RNA polymerase sigma factor (sigma-70 family)